LGFGWDCVCPNWLGADEFAVVVMRLAGSSTDNTVPIIAPIPTPTINNRKAYKIVLAMGLRRVFRDTRTFLGNFCFLTLTEVNFPVPGFNGGIPLFTLGVDDVATGTKALPFFLTLPAGGRFFGGCGVLTTIPGCVLFGLC
jgi:hypothetical protein